MNYSLKQNYFSNIKNRWTHIRNMYNNYYFEAFEKGEKFNPYDMFLFQWTDYMTPIEKAAWQEIRGIGGMQMFPQIPALHYFIDFGDPYQKIGIELDGKQHDKEKDKIRDQRIYNETGWIIFRIPSNEINYTIEKALSELYEKFNGCDCYYEMDELKDKIAQLNQEKILNTDIGVIEAVKFFYSFSGRFFYENCEDLWLYLETLKNHCLVDICEKDILRSINKPKANRKSSIFKTALMEKKYNDEILEKDLQIDGVYTLDMVEDEFDIKVFTSRFNDEYHRILKLIS